MIGFVKRVLSVIKGREISFIFYYIFVECIICDIFYNVHRWFMFLNTKNKKVVKKVNDSFMELNLNDKGISRDLYLYGIREKVATEKMKEILNKDDIVLEIGSNIGYYVLLESKRVSKIYAVEPVPNNFKMLEKNILLNNLKNVETYNISIGDKNGISSIYISDKSNLHSFVSCVGNKKVDVEMKTLDSFISDKEFPTVLRMDVEGYEYEILKSSKKFLEKMKKGSWIFIEIHKFQSRRAKEVFDIIKDSGFVLETEIQEHDRKKVFDSFTYKKKFKKITFHDNNARECFFVKEK